MTQRLIEGEVETDQDVQVMELQAEIHGLRRELQDARLETARAKQESRRAMSALRQQLTPLYRALQMVFGELDAAGVEAMSGAGDGGTVNPRISAVWESWKQKLGGKQAVFIDVLLHHGEMNMMQLKIATKSAQNTVYDTIHKLHKLGLLNKNGGKFSLKQL